MRQITLLQKTRYEKKIEKLQAKLDILNVQLAEAEEHGDSRENAERDAVLQEIGVATAQLNDLQDYLLGSEVIEDTTSNLITIGSLVLVKKLTGNSTPTKSLEAFSSSDTTEIVYDTTTNTIQDTSRLFMIGEKGDTVIEGILDIDSPLGKKVFGNPSGVYSVQIDNGSRIQYDVTKVGPEYSERFLREYPEEDDLFNEIFK